MATEDTQPGAGFQNFPDFGSEIASRNFHIMSLLSRIAGATLVQVVAVGTGTVDVQPLINQSSQSVSDNGVITIVGTPHGILYGLPYYQPQSGISAVEITPTINDIGLAIFADRDISAVVKINSETPGLTGAQAQANPGSRRMFDMSDGLYLGAFPLLNQTITQFVKFDPNSGITITSPIAVTVNAPTATVNAPVVAVNATTSATVTSPVIDLGDGGTLNPLLNSAFATWAEGHIHNVSGSVTSTPTTSPGATTQTTIVQAQ